MAALIAMSAALWLWTRKGFKQTSLVLSQQI